MKTKDIIEYFKEVHGDKYDYSKVEYVNSRTKICIICPKHGEFWQNYHVHKQGCGCPKCARENKSHNMGYNTDSYIKKAKQIHGDKYDYSKVEYNDAHDKICIICPKHGEFWQRACGHLLGYGCSKCAYSNVADKLSISNEEFIAEAKDRYGLKFDYSKTDYRSKHKKVCIICPKHGEFWMTPASHLRGKYGCPYCAREDISIKMSKTTEEWIEEVKKIHGNRYDYSKVHYNGYYKKVCIICPKHGEFWQLAYNHLQGKGCPKCKRSRLEIMMEDFLIKENEEFIYQYRPQFLISGKSHLSVDFYLPKYNIAIECQGKQHYTDNTFYSQDLEKIKQRDLLKYTLCKENGVKILYFAQNKPSEYFGEIFDDMQELLKRIRKNDEE